MRSPRRPGGHDTSQTHNLAFDSPNIARSREPKPARDPVARRGASMAPGALPVLLSARPDAGSPQRLLTKYLDRLRAVADPHDRPVILALGHWLKHPA